MNNPIKSVFKKKKDQLTKEEILKESKLKSANDFINVSDIIGNFLYSKDGHVFAYLKIEPVSLDLLSLQEKIKKVKNFASEFSGERKNYKFFSISRPVDISYLTICLSNALKKADNSIQKDLIKNEIRTVSDFALTGEVIQRQFYMVIWEKNNVDVQSELIKRISILQQKFSNCEIQCEIADQNAIVRLCNLFGNPSFAHVEDSVFEESIPFLKLESGE